MLAELVDHVIGIDPDKDWITAAIIEADTTRFIESARFSADRDGYARAVAWADGHTTPGRESLGDRRRSELRSRAHRSALESR
jgi:hypothetical protein